MYEGVEKYGRRKKWSTAIQKRMSDGRQEGGGGGRRAERSREGGGKGEGRGFQTHRPIN